MINADLHVHSKYSNDGEYEIQDIIDKCVKNNIDILSITDHNGIKGIDEAIPICKHLEIDLIPGIEIDCCSDPIKQPIYVIQVPRLLGSIENDR